MNIKPLRIAIIGSGNIGTDIYMKVMRSSVLQCTLFVGRRPDSQGLEFASREVHTSTDGINALIRFKNSYDLVFDATSALSHQRHAVVLKKLGKKVIDLTPAKLGRLCVPAINISEIVSSDNINMITCGGQASIPIAYAFSQVHKHINYIEVISSIASDTAGPATRMNIDEYIDTTERALIKFSNTRLAKVILNINPAKPSVSMKTTIYASIDDPDMALLTSKTNKIVQAIKQYVPGYTLIVPPYFDGERIVTMVETTGNGDYLPVHAGNLDIITSSAIHVAEYIAANHTVLMKGVAA